METNNSTKPQIIIVKNQKSVGISIILTLLLGPIGLFYSTIRGGVIMIIALIVLYVLVFNAILDGTFSNVSSIILLYLLYCAGCIYWGVKAVNDYNHDLTIDKDKIEEQIEEKTERQIERKSSSEMGIIEFVLLCAFAFGIFYAVYNLFLK